jgi:hypothetical protein
MIEVGGVGGEVLDDEKEEDQEDVAIVLPFTHGWAPVCVECVWGVWLVRKERHIYARKGRGGQEQYSNSERSVSRRGQCTKKPL